MRTGQPLSGEATIPANDPAWSKSSLCSHIPGQPKPIIPVMCTGQLLSGEATIPADDPAWSKLSHCSHIPGQPKPIPPRNEPLLYIPSIHNNPPSHTSLDECELGSHLGSAVAQPAQEIQHGIYYKSRDAERGKHLHNHFDILTRLRFTSPE
jgi:hypothetical protein